MSEKKTAAPEGSEGWESLVEESEGALAPSEELEQAMREAAEAIEAQRADAAPTPPPAPPEGEGQDELAELQDRHIRLAADFDNFRRRALREREEAHQFGHQNLVKDLLSAVDNLERALEHGAQNAEGDAKGILDGIELVHREILGAFAKNGVREIEAKGQLFDPAVHEAMGQIPSADVPSNSVLEVLQKGYEIHDRMLRPSRVIVSCEPENPGASAGTESAEDGSA